MRPPGGAARRGGGGIRRGPRGSGRWRFALPTARKFASKGPRRRGSASCAFDAVRSVMLRVAPGVKVYLACQPARPRRGIGGRGADSRRRSLFGGSLRLRRQTRRLREDKRLEKGRFVRPPIVEGALQLTAAQLALLLEGIDWRRTVAPPRPERPRDRLSARSRHKDQAIPRDCGYAGGAGVLLRRVAVVQNRLQIGRASCRERV